jgi:rhodanese-related sulfurtransferase
MKKAWLAIVEATAMVIVAFVVAFAFNSRSAAGINPFKQPAKVAVAPGTLAARTGGIRVVTLDEARSFVAGGGKIIDARMKARFDEGHIPGAFNLDYYEFQKEIDSVIPVLSKDEEILVYCEGVSCEASDLLSKELYAIGFTKLLLFEGGFEEWSAAGLKVEKGGQ